MSRSEAHLVSTPQEPSVDALLVREQLERILASQLFRNSKRYPSLLRYVVEQALDGHASELKERTLGIEVFGRNPDYDTNVDPVVRISAAEIRKRIAQYYHDPGHDTELRIDLPLGSYIPEFRFPPNRIERAPAVAMMPAIGPPVEVKQPVLLAPASAPPRDYRILAGILLGVLILTAGSMWFRAFAPATALDRFWAPLLDRNKSVLLLIGRIHDPDGRPHGVALSDATAMAMMSGFLQSRKQPWLIRAEDKATFEDLRLGPAVLIGAFNDSWSMRFANSARFTFHKDGPVDWIEDQRKPQSREWRTAIPAAGGPPVTKDFALISRVHDPNTDRVLVAVGGLWGFGTLAAGEFLSDPKYMQAFAAHAPRGWENKNLQIVISTEVIQGNSGPPRLLDSYSW